MAWAWASVALVLAGLSAVVVMILLMVSTPSRGIVGDGGLPATIRARAYSTRAKIIAPKLDRLSKRITQSLLKKADQQVLSGQECGLSICVYYRGQEIANVCAGKYRSVAGRGNAWRPVTPSTRFMGYSVSKGIAAATFLAMADAGLMKYSDPVEKFWPEFCSPGGGKKGVTIAQALSHRAGLHHTPPSFLVKFIYNLVAHGPRVAWRCGEGFIERSRPAWVPGTQAVYHPVSFSWIAGGIARRVSRLSNSESALNLELSQRVCKPLCIDPREITIGDIPPIEDIHIARLEHPSFKGALGESSWWRRKLGLLEAFLFCFIGNMSRWRRLHLPSSNAVWTPRAVARIYGALANNGVLSVADSTSNDDRKKEARLVSESAIQLLKTQFRSPRVPGGNGQGPARLGVGFCPWIAPELHGPVEPFVERVACHNGMGGCAAFGELMSEDGDSETGSLAICIGKTTYDPALCVGIAAVSPSTVELIETVKEAIRVEMKE